LAGSLIGSKQKKNDTPQNEMQNFMPPSILGTIHQNGGFKMAEVKLYPHLMAGKVHRGTLLICCCMLNFP
jgi:hypothetical protein